MPFVRYTRDRRGYETLYVMHAFEGGGGRAPRPRVLYACRTVPYAKVGRMAIDESVQRRIETAYPALTFEWPKLLKEAAQSAPRPERTDARQDRNARGRKPRPEPGTRGAKASQVPRVPRVPLVPEVRFEVPVPDDTPEPAEPDSLESTAPEPLASTSELIEWDPEPEPEPERRTEPTEPLVPLSVGPLLVDRAWPVVEVIGEERTLILRGRYIEIAHRVLSRVADPAERHRLFREAARLNPEEWQTPEQARAGAATFEEVYRGLAEQLRRQPPV